MGVAPLQSVIVERKDTNEFSGCYDNKTSLHVLMRQTHIQTAQLRKDPTTAVPFPAVLCNWSEAKLVTHSPSKRSLVQH